MRSMLYLLSLALAPPPGCAQAIVLTNPALTNPAPVSAQTNPAHTNQLKRTPGVLQPRSFLTLGDTITVSATPATLNMTLTPAATATAATAISISTTWAGISLLSSISLWASFGSSTSALSGGSPVHTIPSSAILGMDPAGIPTSFTAFTATSPLGAAGALQLFSSTSILNLSGTHADSLWLEINLASLPQLPAATYSGTLSLVAQAF